MTKITLATLPDATEQQVFDQVATHLLTQNRQSRDTSAPDSDFSFAPGCRYRFNDDGVRLMCAAGCLIGDDEYDPHMEDRGWDDLAGDDTVPSEHWELITQLQWIHDTHAPEAWRECLARLATDFDLHANILETIPA